MTMKIGIGTQAEFKVGQVTVGQTRYPSGRLGNKILWDGLYDMNAIYGFRTALNSTSYVETGVTYIEANSSFQAGSVTNPSSSLAIATADMGDWKNTWIYNRFRPCMLKTNGKVDYFLDPDDISKKMDGTASDIENTSYDGNAMVQIGQIWVQIVAQIQILLLINICFMMYVFLQNNERVILALPT